MPQTFLSSHDPTVWRTISVLEYLQQTWEAMDINSEFSEISPAIKSGIDSLDKWYHKIDATHAYFICLGTYLLVSVQKGNNLTLINY